MSNLKEDIKNKKPIIGLERTLKKLKVSGLKKVYVTSNSNAKEQLLLIGKTLGAEIIILEETSKELGVLCKKSFSISVLGFE